MMCPPVKSQAIEIDSSCEKPVHVVLCSIDDTPEPILGIESAMAEIGCVTDASGVVIGKVLACKTIDEDGGNETLKKVAMYFDGTVDQDYTGMWGVCPVNATCTNEGFLGVITNLDLLEN